MAEHNIIQLVGDYVLGLLSSNLPEDISFHKVEHTCEVVKAASEIARESDFSERQLEIVILAAWFHDCGYTTTYINHEDSSKAIAARFLRSCNYPRENIDRVLSCIEATRFPQNPKSPEEEVLADADLFHFTKAEYPRYEQQLRMEFKIYLGKNYTDIEWAEMNYALLKSHIYYTMYGKSVLQQFKEINIERLKITLTKWSILNK